MKMYDKPIDVICRFKPDSTIEVIKFRFINADKKEVVIPIKSMGKQEKRRLYGHNIVDIHCLAVLNGYDSIINLHFFTTECKWVLHKM